jgi:hypothetical protein
VNLKETIRKSLAALKVMVRHAGQLPLYGERKSLGCSPHSRRGAVVFEPDIIRDDHDDTPFASPGGKPERGNGRRKQFTAIPR